MEAITRALAARVREVWQRAASMPQGIPPCVPSSTAPLTIFPTMPPLSASRSRRDLMTTSAARPSSLSPLTIRAEEI